MGDHSCDLTSAPAMPAFDGALLAHRMGREIDRRTSGHEDGYACAVMSKHDVIVIGSGIGGLTAALTCAQRGRDVLVLEAAKQIGGFINPFSRKHFTFDTGIHYIGEMEAGQSLHRRFDKLGVLDLVTFREISPDGFDRYVFPGYEIRMCKGIDAFRDRVVADFPAETAGIDRFFDRLREVDALTRATTQMQSGWSAVRLVPRLPMLMRYRKATYADVLDEFFVDPHLRAALSGPCGDIGLPPSKASGLLMMALLAHFLSGAHFPIGGTRKVRDAYVELLVRHGATLKRNSPVARILVEGDRVVGVRTTKGDEHRAPVVISNADASVTLLEMLGAEHLPSKAVRKAEGIEQSLGSLCVFVGTDLQPHEHGLDDANIWHYPSLDIDGLYSPVLQGRIGDEMPFFLTVPTLKDPSGSHAPPGKHTVELITFAPWQPFARWQGQPALRRDAEYKAFKKALGLELVAQAEIYLPGLGDQMEVFEVATPLTNTSFVNVPRGAIYGPDHTPAQFGLGRYSPRGPIDGLFLCGSSVLGCGIGACVASGAMAAKMALDEREGLIRQVTHALGRPRNTDPRPKI